MWVQADTRNSLFLSLSYDHKLKEARLLGAKKGVSVGIALFLTFFFIFLVDAAAFWFGGYLISEEKAQGGDVITVGGTPGITPALLMYAWVVAVATLSAPPLSIPLPSLPPASHLPPFFLPPSPFLLPCPVPLSLPPSLPPSPPLSLPPSGVLRCPNRCLCSRSGSAKLREPHDSCRCFCDHLRSN